MSKNSTWYEKVWIIDASLTGTSFVGIGFDWDVGFDWGVEVDCGVGFECGVGFDWGVGWGVGFEWGVREVPSKVEKKIEGEHFFENQNNTIYLSSDMVCKIHQERMRRSHQQK